MYGLKIFSKRSQATQIRAEMGDKLVSLTNKGGYHTKIGIQQLKRKLKLYVFNACCFFKENNGIRNHSNTYYLSYFSWAPKF